MYRRVEGNLAYQLPWPSEELFKPSQRMKRVRKRKIKAGRVLLWLLIMPILVASLGVCYTAKRTEIAATSYRLTQANRELEALRDEKSRLEVAILTAKAEIVFDAAVANAIAMRPPREEDVGVVQ